MKDITIQEITGNVLYDGSIILNIRIPKDHKQTVQGFLEECNTEIEIIKHFYTTDFYEKSSFNDSQVLSVYYLIKGLFYS